MVGFGAGTTAEQVTLGIDLQDQIAIVTGANAGIGAETARVLALRGALVVMACRNTDAGQRTRTTILRQSRGDIVPEQLEVQPLDLADLQSVDRFARQFVQSRRRLHLLINNAGLMTRHRETTRQGFEMHFGVHHLGHYLLTCLLRDTLEASAPARVISLSSEALRFAGLSERFQDLQWRDRPFRWWQAYGDSKLMNVLFARELDARLGGSSVVSHAVHPGIVRTSLGREGNPLVRALGAALRPALKSAAQGAATTLYAATAPEWGTQGGRYFSNCAARALPRLARDPSACAALWKLSADLIRETGLELQLPMSETKGIDLAN